MNWNENNIFVLNDFDDVMEANIPLALTLEIQKQRKYRDGRIDLYINSFGGYAHLVFHLTSLIELAKNDGVVVRTIVPSIAYSAGSILAITGTPGERYIDANAEHLIHYGRQGSMESTPEQLERNHVQKTEHFKRIKRHYQQYTNIPDIDTLMNDDSAFINSTKSIKWGLADKKMDKFDIGEES
jgi:ATP-dependent protease ClpP protease subunit